MKKRYRTNFDKLLYDFLYFWQINNRKLNGIFSSFFHKKNRNFKKDEIKESYLLIMISCSHNIKFRRYFNVYEMFEGFIYNLRNLCICFQFI